MIKKAKKAFAKDKSIILYILAIFLISRVFLTIIGVASKTYFENVRPDLFAWKFSGISWLNIWGIWDSGYYLDIAKRGYTGNQNFEFPVMVSEGSLGENQNTYNFFPFYPILIKFVTGATGDYFISALIVSNFCLLALAFFLYKFVDRLYGSKIAKYTASLLFLFPTSFIFSGAFAESTTLLFTILAFYFSNQKKWINAGLSSAISALAKITGALSVISIIFSLKTNGFNAKKIISLTLPFAALGIFFYYHQVSSGNFFIYFATAKEGWNVQFINPVNFIATLLLVPNISSDFMIQKFLVIIFFAFEIWLLVYSYKLLRRDLWVYWLLAFLLPLSSGFAAGLSLPRHALLLFPQYIALSLILAKIKSERLTIATYFVFFLLQISLMALWVNGIAVV